MAVEDLSPKGQECEDRGHWAEDAGTVGKAKEQVSVCCCPAGEDGAAVCGGGVNERSRDRAVGPRMTVPGTHSPGLVSQSLARDRGEPPESFRVRFREPCAWAEVGCPSRQREFTPKLGGPPGREADSPTPPGLRPLPLPTPGRRDPPRRKDPRTRARGSPVGKPGLQLMSLETRPPQAPPPAPHARQSVSCGHLDSL